MNRHYLVGLIVGFLILTASIVVPLASAHGPHHPPGVMPNYDCFYNPDGWDTRGDVVITRDGDLDRWNVWKCHCEMIEFLGFRCWWVIKGSFKSKDKAVEYAKKITGAPGYSSMHIRTMTVRWLADHPDGGCVIHIAWREARHWGRKG